MIVKMHSIMYGYRKLKAQVRVENGLPQLHVEEMGYMSPLECIKQGINFEQMTEGEKQLLRKAGYRFRD